jgi:hypothetical protein
VALQRKKSLLVPRRLILADAPKLCLRLKKYLSQLGPVIAVQSAPPGFLVYLAVTATAIYFPLIIAVQLCSLRKSTALRHTPHYTPTCIIQVRLNRVLNREVTCSNQSG